MDQAARKRMLAHTVLPHQDLVELKGITDAETGENLIQTVTRSTVLQVNALLPRFPLLDEALKSGGQTVSFADAFNSVGEAAMCAIISQSMGYGNNDKEMEAWIATWPEECRFDYLIVWSRLTMPRGIHDFFGRMAKLPKILHGGLDIPDPTSSPNESETDGQPTDSSNPSNSMSQSPTIQTEDDTSTASKSSSTEPVPNSASQDSKEILTN